MPVAPLVLVGVAGLLVGLFAGRVRPRTTRWASSFSSP